VGGRRTSSLLTFPYLFSNNNININNIAGASQHDAFIFLRENRWKDGISGGVRAAFLQKCYIYVLD